VIDCSDALRDEKSEQVQKVLCHIHADEIPCLEVYNKVDARTNMQPHIDYNEAGKPQRVWLSALTGNGIALLQQAIAARLLGEFITETIQLPTTAGKLRAAFYEQDSVTAETLADDGHYVLSIRIRERVLNHILRQANVTLAELLPPTTSM
jgi:GTPase